jgi:hypothetical protein
MRKIGYFIIVLATLLMLGGVAMAQELANFGNECLDCLPHVMEKNWPAALTCALTAAVAGVIRYFEKRRIERQNRA